MPTVISPELAGLNVRPLRDSTLEAVRDVTRAVLVTRELDAGVNALLRFVSPADVIKIQERLLRLAASAESETEFWPR
ncbi:hypothetical protein K1X59_17040 [Microbacterium sp. Se5.02b]|nr:hypothetical protein K1X59_17040 [Microbacterium sp. Se5.02b]